MPAQADVLSVPLPKRLLWVTAICGFGWFLGYPFHYFGVGDRFTPLFIPIGVACYLVEPGIAVAVGFLLPLLSALATGQPPFHPPVVWLVAGECVVFGGMISFCYIKKSWTKYPSVLAGIVAGKVELFLYVTIASHGSGTSPFLNAFHSVIRGLPGSLLVLLVVPLLVKWIEKHIGPDSMATA